MITNNQALRFVLSNDEEFNKALKKVQRRKEKLLKDLAFVPLIQKVEALRKFNEESFPYNPENLYKTDN
jgi:hypothetical protein